MRVLLLSFAAIALFAAAASTGGGERRDVRIGFVGLHGGAFDVISAIAEDTAGVEVGYVADEAIAAGNADFGRFDVVLLQHLREEDGRALNDAITAARTRDPPTRFFALSGSGRRTGSPPEVSPIESDAALSAYYRQPRRENLAKLLARAAGIARGEDLDLGEPLPVELGALHHPARAEPFADVAALRDFVRARGIDVDHAPRVAVVCHSTHYLLQQPAVAQALVDELERRGAMAFVAIDSEGDAYRDAMLALAPEAVIHTCHSTEPLEFRERLGAPHLTSAFFRKQSIDAWRASPQGLAPSEVVFHCVTQELIGGIEPFATCGTRHGGGSEEAFEPIPDRVARLVERTLNHVRLRRTQNADKRVAIVYYDREASRSSLFRGSPTGMFLNAPRSVLAVLARMKAEGYTVDVPADEDDLIERAQRTGRVIGINDPGEAQRLAATGLVPVIPLSTYRAWYEDRVPAAARAALEARFGPPPGTINVVQHDGEPAIVVPCIQLGNVVLLPQPLRGEAYDPSQTHDRVTPIPHSYLAAYLWIEHGFQAHAMVHFGTHGSEFLLPGKSVGLAETDWSDVVIGRLPNIQPWVQNNTGESILAKRRSYAVLVDHLVPPTTEAGLADGLAVLHNEVDRFQQLEPGALRETLRKNLTARVVEENLAVDLGLELATGATPLTDEQIDTVDAYLHAIEEDLTPTSLHELGSAPADDARIPWLVHCAGEPLLAELETIPGLGELAAHHGRPHLRTLAAAVLRFHLREGKSLVQAIRAVGGDVGEPSERLTRVIADVAQIDQGLERTGDEIGNLLAALDGRFIPPGPGNSPDRNPRSVPTGRNMYLIDPREVPTPESWEVGKKLADDLIAQHREETGAYPEKIAFDLRAMSTFRDFGVMESQILWLLGCEPVREKNGQVLDVRVVPRAELGRPRVDVFIRSGNRYNDMLADRLVLLDRAARLAGAEDDADNGVRRSTVARRAHLIEQGLDASRADTIAAARIFGAGLGGDNASVSYLIERSGDWDTPDEIARAQLHNWRFAYTEGAWGEEAEAASIDAIRGSQYVLRSWSDVTRGPTTDRYQWKHGGALALAVEHVNGFKPRYVLSDLRDLKRARLVEAEDALRMDFRVRAFNRKWIEGLMKEGYAGADQLQVVVANAYGWQTTRSESVPDEFLEKFVDLYVRDSLDLGLREFFEKENPWALQGISATLLEMSRKGMWNASPESLALLAETLARSRAEHGASGGLLTAGNEAFEAYARELAAAAGVADATASSASAPQPAPATNASAAAPAPSTPPPQPPPAQGAPPPASPESTTVTGVELATSDADAVADEDASRTALVALGVALALIVAGFSFRRSA